MEAEVPALEVVADAATAAAVALPPPPPLPPPEDDDDEDEEEEEEETLAGLAAAGKEAFPEAPILVSAELRAFWEACTVAALLLLLPSMGAVEGLMGA